MRRIPIYQVDAFADSVFRGNPAAVCPLPTRHGLPDETLQAIAAENNLSETAFLSPDRDPVPLRWFTPRAEVKLCGHATLASGFVIFEFLQPDRREVTFETLSGELSVRRDDGAGTDAGTGADAGMGADDGATGAAGNGAAMRLSMDFPSITSERLDEGDVPAALLDGLGTEPNEVRMTSDDWNYIAVYGDEEAVAALAPDFALLEKLHPHGVSVTAPAAVGEVDFVSRYFVPSYGIPEDPVTGSIHCALAPYWADRLERDRLTAVQLSERRGRIDLAVAGGRVELRGSAVTYLTGEIRVP
ncbi:MAG: PhzF family phenazine biosynthesis protein [Gemmatimonadota bacterium]